MSSTLPNAASLINLALKMAGVLGVGQTAQAEDTNDAFTLMNAMLAQWQRKRWLVYALVDTPFVSTGAESYTVGLGENFNIARPDKVESVFARYVPTGSTPVDYPLEIIEAREDYNRIPLKLLGTFPQVAFYDAQYPVGNLFVWPVPEASLFEIHITTKAVLSQFTNTTSTMALPPEYQEAIIYNLVPRLRAMYGLPPDPVTNALAVSALATIRAANAQIPRLQVPPEAGVHTRYNVFSDQGQ
ncbi:MAG TPA: hypothetical protein PLD10_07150 [Rhodopila sp.]|nr:hypothetical protein [Rhodopila sp.]